MEEKLIMSIGKAIINNEKLTHDYLLNKGFNEKNINKYFIKNNNEYTIKSVKYLFKYGKNLIKTKNMEKAYIVFNKCLELESNHTGSIYEFLYKAINEKDYEEVFKYIDILLDKNNQNIRNDANFYLLLLSLITKLPNKYNGIVKNLKYEDIIVGKSDNRYNIEKEEKMRNKVYNKNVTSAIKKYGQEENNIYELINIALLKQAILSIKIRSNDLTKYATEEDYDYITQVLENLNRSGSLNTKNKMALYITKNIKQINETQILPEITKYYTDDVYDAITSNNFVLAEALSKRKIKKYNIDINNDIVSILLQKINSLIKKIGYDESYIPLLYQNYYDLLINRGVKVVKKDEIDTINNELEKVGNLPLLSTFTINHDNEKLLILKYQTESRIMINQLFKEAKELNALGNYEEAIKKYKIILGIENVKPFVYSMISFCYFRLHNYKEALNYIIIAKALEKDNPSKDYNEIINKLQNKDLIIDKEDNKPNFEMKEEEFETHKNYDILNVEEITDDIFKNKLSINEVKEKYSLSSEKLCLLYLMYAREFYTFSNFTKGDYYLKEASKLKCGHANEIEQLRKDKKFLKNRKDEVKRLILQ